MNVEQAVRDRYSTASQEFVPQLCCPVDYNTDLLKVLPDEIIQRDYGCGDPSKHVRAGETVLDLGSGAGKICFIASQIVGETGAVHGVDMNEDMLALANKYKQEVGERVGWQNVHFHRGRIQDLALDLDQFDSFLAEQSIGDSHQLQTALDHAEQLRVASPMIQSDSIDVVLSNCVLNLVAPKDRQQLFSELHRVLKIGGRAIISDIVCDEPVPEHMQQNDELWSGCISGAHVEKGFLDAFADAGFHGVEIVERQSEPWAVVEGIEFRSMTVRAFKGSGAGCFDHHQAVIYRGPWKGVVTEEGLVLERGVRSAVCAKTFETYQQDPYSECLIPVAPKHSVQPEQAKPFDCDSVSERSPEETKGEVKLTILPEGDCCSGDSCC